MKNSWNIPSILKYAFIIPKINVLVFVFQDQKCLTPVKHILTHKAYVKILQTLYYNKCLWCIQYLQINRKKALWLLFLLFIWKGSNNNYYFRGTDGIQNIEEKNTYVHNYVYIFILAASCNCFCSIATAQDCVYC